MGRWIKAGERRLNLDHVAWFRERTRDDGKGGRVPYVELLLVGGDLIEVAGAEEVARLVAIFDRLASEGDA